MSDDLEFCTGCFEPLTECACDRLELGEDIHALAPGTVLEGRYVLGRNLGRTAAGFIYLAVDQRMGRKVAIRECFPDGAAERGPAGSVYAAEEGRERLQTETGAFLAQARQLVRLPD